MKNRRHTPEQIIRKLREADRFLAEGKTISEVAKYLDISERQAFPDHRHGPAPPREGCRSLLIKN